MHRDIKPDNFLMGTLESDRKVFIIDYGLSKRYIDRQTGDHIPYKEGKSMIGTARYASVNTHLGIELSRRDDLESIGYVLIYFLKGSLPWQKLGGDTKEEQYDRIKNKKVTMPLATLCSDMPSEFHEYMKYCFRLKFDETPDYVYLQSLFKKVMGEKKLKDDSEFDWFKTKQFRNQIHKACFSAEMLMLPGEEDVDPSKKHQIPSRRAPTQLRPETCGKKFKVF